MKVLQKRKAIQQELLKRMGIHQQTVKQKVQGLGLGLVGAGVGTFFGPLGTLIGGGIGGAVGSMMGSNTKSEATNNSSTISNSSTDGTSKTEGESISDSTQKSQSETLTTGTSRNLQLSFENKSVTNLLEQIDEQLERLKHSADFGMWNTACYFIAPSQLTTQVAANTFKAIMRGENSAIENSYINTWTVNDSEI